MLTETTSLDLNVQACSVTAAAIDGMNSPALITTAEIGRPRDDVHIDGPRTNCQLQPFEVATLKLGRS